MNPNTLAKMQRRPFYAVLFTSADDVFAPYSPITVNSPTLLALTGPHGLDREVATALPALWYCLHLPNYFTELTDIPLRIVKATQGLDRSHHILLAPAQIFDPSHYGDLSDRLAPVIVICPDDLVEAVARPAKTFGFPFPPVPFSALSAERLRADWRAIHEHFFPELPYLGRELALSSRLDLAPTNLPRLWLARQMARGEDEFGLADFDIEELREDALSQQVVLAALARLENEEATPDEAPSRMPETLEHERTHARLPVTVAFPGVPSAYVRKVYGSPSQIDLRPLEGIDPRDTWAVEISDRSDDLIERAAVEFAASHHAIASTGLGLVLSGVPLEAFHVLAQLEAHFRQRPTGRAVNQLLLKLNQLLQPMWTELLAASVARASVLTVFSNFPLGLLRLPGDSAPLACRVPVTYRPLLPLTRTLQYELTSVGEINFTTGFRVLVAECIAASDPVGQLSRMGWQFATRAVRDSGQAVPFHYVETLSVDRLRAAIADHQPDILVLSAHGTLHEPGNTAGIVVGDRVCLGPELGPMPPLVLLSACHVAPRGTAVVNIADLLLREGARAVLGTQVPVDVRHNSMLMMRFFVYLTEVLAHREHHSSVAEIWHRVQSSNAVNDILTGSTRLEKWALETTSSGRPVLQEFMSGRWEGQVRLGHVYEDTERVLGLIADEQGQGSRVRNWFRAPGYVPESLFYAFAGRPDRIMVRAPLGVVRDRLEGRMAAPET